MRALTSRRLLVLALPAVGLLLAAGCARSTNAGTTALPQRSASAGPVTVTVTPESVDSSGARFRIELDNHQVALTGDYAATSTLTVGGTAWRSPRWSGDKPGGHHRSGILSFASTGPATGTVQLQLGGLSGPVTLAWTLPAA